MKIRRILILIMTAFVLAGFSACQNNGHIGWIFGVWRVDEYSVDGVRQESDLLKSTTFAFQNNIVQVVAFVDDHQTDIVRYGTWSHEGEEFTLDFSHYDDFNDADTGIYAAPEWLGMTSIQPMNMTISDRKNDSFTLVYIDSDGARKVYKMKKTW